MNWRAAACTTMAGACTGNTWSVPRWPRKVAILAWPIKGMRTRAAWFTLRFQTHAHGIIILIRLRFHATGLQLLPCLLRPRPTFQTAASLTVLKTSSLKWRTTFQFSATIWVGCWSVLLALIDVQLTLTYLLVRFLVICWLLTDTYLHGYSC